MTREEALALLRRYNQEEFHVRHAITVGRVMRRMAQELGRADEADFWECAGILHDIDFEQWPEEHCKKAVELLQDAGAEEELIQLIHLHQHMTMIGI